MKRIYAATVRMSDTDYIKDRLQTTIMNLNDCDIIERFLDTIFECDVKEYELPKVTIDYDEWTCTLNSFDYITDKVRYKREKDVIRYFKTQEDANTYIDSIKMARFNDKYVLAEYINHALYKQYTDELIFHKIDRIEKITSKKITM